jgi:hypothetical protein
MNRMVIKRIAPLSLAKVAGTLYAILGLVLGCIFSLVAMAGAFGAQSSRAAGFGAIIGVGAIIFLPILYGVIGFIGTLIAAWLYNVIAGAVGGIELEVQ